MRWYMVMFESPDHERVVKVMRFDTMKQMAYILDVSNDQTLRKEA